MADSATGFAGTVIGDTLFQLGEGPTYDPVRDKAVWFDILGHKIVAFEFASGKLSAHDLPMMASAIAFIDDNRQMIISEDGLCVRDGRNGTMERYLAVEADNPATRSNDARVHPSGALWLSTMGKGAEDGAGTIYHVFKGKLSRLFPNVSIPNAICFSPDGATGYFTDTRKGEVMRLALDPETGLPAGEPTIFLPKDCAAGNPDGAIVDAHGNFWNARHGGGTVEVYSPDGAHLKSIVLPAKQVTCPAFVGRNADRLLVTSSYEGMDAAARQQEPLAGATFLLDEPVAGRIEPRMVI